MTKTTRASKRRAEAKERAALIAKLGWAPEKPGDPEDRYCATAGELWQLVAEKYGIDEANEVRNV